MGYSLYSNVTFLNQHPTFPFDSCHLLFALGGILLIIYASFWQPVLTMVGGHPLWIVVASVSNRISRPSTCRSIYVQDRDFQHSTIYQHNVSCDS